MFGLLNLDKPAGITSRDVVNRVQRVARRVKIGHAGTLDPLAEGVLVLCLGQATRLIQYVQRMPKTYRGRFRLGVQSDTEDVQGNLVPLDKPPIVRQDELMAVLPRFVGAIEQMPPAYSALKIAGRRAYALARQGEHVELTARTIQVHRLELLDFDYPHFSLDIVCGSGTYVRSLGRDIARALGTEAIMTNLQRTAIGRFQQSDACRLEQLRAENLSEFLLPAHQAVDALPKVDLRDEEIGVLRWGQTIDDRFHVGADEIAGLDPHGHLVALLAPASDGSSLRPTRNFNL